MRIAYSPSTRLYAQGLLRCVRQFLRRGLWGFTGFAGVFLAVLSIFGAYPVLGQETPDIFVDDPDFMRLRAERFANSRDSLARVDFYHGMGEEYWIDRRGLLKAPEKMIGAAVAADEADSLALVDFYHAAGGEDWIDRTGWLEYPVMDWHGVTLSEAGRVVRLELIDNKLTGHLSLELGRLTELEYLVLTLRERFDLDRLGGSIPASLGHLAKLKYLDLSINDLTGPIPPELGNLTELEVLDLKFNLWLTGSIPASLGRLAKLKYLNLHGNALTGPIPPSLGELVELKSLVLAVNKLTGSIPASLGRLTKLKDLNLSHNALAGPIPPALNNLTEMTLLDLRYNCLTGSIPVWLGKLPKLALIWLDGNALAGFIPMSLVNLANLRVLNLSNNDLEGALPGNIANAKYLSELALADNYLNALPDLSGLSVLYSVSVGLNRLTFEDFEDRELPAGVRYYDYAPQRRVPTHVARSAFHATFSVEVGGTANKYQWYREGSVKDEAVPGATSDTLVVSLSDPPLCYYCKITNAKVPDLTLYSKQASIYDHDTQKTLDMKASTLRVSLEEGGEPGSYTLALNADPGGTVTVTPISSNEASATVSGALAFDRSNWGIPQTVTVTPVDDANLDDETVTITHVVAGYACVAPSPIVTVTVADATIIISAEEEGQETPTAFALEQNYPNPFNPSTTIAFTLNKAQRATLSVYDLLGQKVQTLVDGMRPAARYRIPFDASELASGTYLYVLRTEEEIAVKTMLLLK